MSLLGILIILWGHAVRVVGAVVLLKLGFEFSILDLGGYRVSFNLCGIY